MRRIFLSCLLFFCVKEVLADGSSADSENLDSRVLQLKERGTPVPLVGVRETWGATAILPGVGASVEFELVTLDGEHLGPILGFLWENQDEGILLDSLPTLNAILAKLPPSTERERGVADITQIVPLMARQLIVEGERTGFILNDGNRSHLFAALRKTLASETCQELEARLTRPKVSIEGRAWKAVWVEIDRQGGAEHVCANGTLTPFAVNSVERSVLLPSGSIPVRILSLRVLGATDDRRRE